MDLSLTGVTLYKPILHRELNTSAGSLWKHMEIAGNKAVLGAKSKVGVDTGKLRKSIHKRHLGNPTGQYMLIGSWTVDYALAHHQGTKPHLIYPDRAKILSFSSKSRVVRTPGPVNHPGTRANPYLTSQLWHFRSI